MDERMRGGLTLRMALATALLTLIVGAAFGTMLLAITNVLDSTQSRSRARQQLVAADALETLVIDLETGVRGFLITGKERFLEPWNEARAAFPKQASSLEHLVADDPVQLRRVRRIVRAATSYIRDYSVPLVAAVRRHDASARSIARTDEGKRRVDALREAFATFSATGRADLSAREADANVAGRRALVGAGIGVAGSVLLILLFAGYLTRVLVRPVRRAALMADRLAGGELGTRMTESAPAEIGALERSFNVMANSLEKGRDQLARLAEEQAALRRVATLVAQTASSSEVFETVTREVGLLSGADLARMERYETDGTVTGVAGWSRDVDQLAVGTRFALEGVSIAALVLTTSRPVRVDSFAHASGPIAQEARELGIRSSVGCPIVVAGRLWGVIAASSKAEAPFPADTESQIAEFTALVATAIANAESRADLAASRVRIVATADETRRRIERDLHDGAQQRLVSLALELRAAQTAVPPELGELESELSRVAEGLTSVLDELREIARGIHPAILAEGGLGPALKTLARRSPIPVQLDVRAEARLPERVEVAAYYVVSETLTNAAKHAHASVVHVEVEAVDGVLRISVRDDGAGGADPTRGSGLVGLKDRVEALGGTTTVQSPLGDGTSVAVELPLDN